MKKVLVPPLPPHYALNMLPEEDNYRLNARRCIEGKSRLMTIDTGASVMIARPDITAGLLRRELSRPYVLQVASGKTLPLLKEALVPECPESSQYICGFEVSGAATGR
jgi:hypothetical protein